MRDLELLDILSIISLYYQSDSNQILRNTATLDDLTKQNGNYLRILIAQNEKIIHLLEKAYEHKDERNISSPQE